MRYLPYDKSLIAKQVKDYVDGQRNYRNPSLTTTMTAKALGIARSTLIKVMSEEMHMTFTDYVTKVRVQRARHHIVTAKGKADMENVALLVGFRSKTTLRRKYLEHYKEKI